MTQKARVCQEGEFVSAGDPVLVAACWEHPGALKPGHRSSVTGTGIQLLVIVLEEKAPFVQDPKSIPLVFLK